MKISTWEFKITWTKLSKKKRRDQPNHPLKNGNFFLVNIKSNVEQNIIKFYILTQTFLQTTSAENTKKNICNNLFLFLLHFVRPLFFNIKQYRILMMCVLCFTVPFVVIQTIQEGRLKFTTTKNVLKR